MSWDMSSARKERCRKIGKGALGLEKMIIFIKDCEFERDDWRDDQCLRNERKAHCKCCGDILEAGQGRLWIHQFPHPSNILNFYYLCKDCEDAIEEEIGRLPCI